MPALTRRSPGPAAARAAALSALILATALPSADAATRPVNTALPTVKTRMRDGLIRLRDCLGVEVTR